jgi:hypothetical protein
MTAYENFKQQTTRVAQVLMLGHDRRFKELAEELSCVVFCDKTRDDLWFYYRANDKVDLIDRCFSGKDFSCIVSEFHNTFVPVNGGDKIEFAFEVASGTFEHKDQHGVLTVAQLYVATMLMNEDILSEFYYVD